jgi:hypothetical protein
MTRGALAALFAVLLASGACSETREPIVVHRTTVVVENQSGADWTSVEVWVNDHYRVTTQSLAAGGRLDVPLTTLVAGYGQRFDPRRYRVFGVEVTAKTPAGDPVRLTWGKGRRR